ncbi:Gp37 family protein [Escherichia albertii]|uniref:Gp37 family protein n=1 Tax=Escherichia albertii TaxID=208962 RepID=UPI0007441D4A|nr:Gp37 family protein [Escherichia albertii]
MKVLSVMNYVVVRLRDRHPEMDIFISSTDAQKYIPQTQQITVIINYSGSVFTTPESSDAIVQQQILRLTATVIVGKNCDALNALDHIRSALGGLQPPDCDHLIWLEKEINTGESDGFCRYILEMATSSLFIAEQDSTDLPLLTEVNYEETE